MISSLGVGDMRVLRRLGELTIAVRAGELDGVGPIKQVYVSLAKLHRWGYAQRQRIPETGRRRIYEYSLTEEGRRALEGV